MNDDTTIFLVDDDEAALRSLRWLVQSVHQNVQCYSNAIEFLESFDSDRIGCLVLDVRMPHMSGLQLQDRLNELGSDLPIIIVSGHAEVSSCKRAFKSGAFDFIEKPVDDQALLDMIAAALEQHQRIRAVKANSSDVAEALAKLTPRESEVLDLVLEGKELKQIAPALGIGVQTAAKHRARMLTKMGVGNDVELVRLLLAMPVAT